MSMIPPTPPRNPVRDMLAVPPQQGVPQFNPGAAGAKVYSGGSFAPTRGPVANPQGYAVRDSMNAAKLNALNKAAGGI